MPRTRVVIQSRLNSSRLPGKAMLTIAGMPLIELVARRASRTSHEVIVATSEETYDARIADHLSDVGIPVLRGSLDDVLGRFVAATADLDEDDRIVRLTGDNPLADADLVDELIRAMDESGHTYGRVDIERVPEGLGAEVFTARALRAAHVATRAAYDREHVTPWLRRTYGELLFVPESCPRDVHAYRATVDTLGDYVRVADLFRHRDDAVDVPWQQLMAELVQRVDAQGPRVPRRNAAGLEMSVLALTAKRFDERLAGESAEAQSARLRSLLTVASERGISHVDVGGGDGRSPELLRATSEPALTKRFGLICRIAPPSFPPDSPGELPALAIEASTERAFAALGRRSVDMLLLTGGAATHLAWPRLRAYRDEGVTRRIGIVASTPADLDWARTTPDLDAVQVPAEMLEIGPTIADGLEALAARGVAVLLVASEASAGSPALSELLSDLPNWVSSVVIDSLDSDALGATVATLRPWASSLAED